MIDKNLEKIAFDVYTTGFDIHQKYGPGLLEKIYALLLCNRLRKMGYFVETERFISFEDDGILYPNSLRADMVINNCFAAELKSIECMHPLFFKQLLTYLRFANIRLGFVMNFGMHLFRDGVTRVANNYYPDNAELTVFRDSLKKK
jgi:GxxExxY protein